MTGDRAKSLDGDVRRVTFIPIGKRGNKTQNLLNPMEEGYSHPDLGENLSSTDVILAADLKALNVKQMEIIKKLLKPETDNCP